MTSPIYLFLKNYSTDTYKINRLLVTAYLKQNSLDSKNSNFLKQYIITDDDKNEMVKVQLLLSLFEKFDLEDLLKLFEYVISPEEKIVTGAVYTPLYIREFIINNVFQYYYKIRIADIACGCGGFLISTATKIRKASNLNYSEIIEENLWGLDIATYSIERTKIMLSLLALENGEDKDFKFNLFVGNALDFHWKQRSSRIRINQGFDLIVGNPPYVCSRNIDDITKNLLKKWNVTNSGHPDLYIPFFQIALENIKNGGTLGYITVNTFFKSINGRALRKYFSEERFEFKIIDFKDEQIFQKRNTYTCICVIKKEKSEYVEYTICSSSALNCLRQQAFVRNTYEALDDVHGWNLISHHSSKPFISKVEGFKKKIFSNFSFSTGVATLKNRVYKFKPFSHDSKYYYWDSDGDIIMVEKEVCREIINSNRITTEQDLDNLKEQIIFPYSWSKENKRFEILEEIQFQKTYPKAYAYLKSKKKILSQRDKGEKEYEKWYAYGRRQGLDIKGVKLFLPHITNNPRFVISLDEKLLFCNGEAIISDSETELKILKKILESQIFWSYIKLTSKPYASGYLSLGKNYLKLFSIPDFSEPDKKYLLNTKSKKKVLELLLKKYSLSQDELNLSQIV